MSVTVIDDLWVRTHDEARDLLRYAALGATVVIERLEREHCPETRRYAVVLDGAVDYAVSAADAYSLPCAAPPLAARVNALCREGRRALALAKARAYASL